MATTLPSGIKKFDPSDTVNRAAFNGNWETIDGLIGDMSTVPTTAKDAAGAIGELDGELVAHKADFAILQNARNGINSNAIINGNFDVWQRGTNFTYTSVNRYTADRWLLALGSGLTAVVSRQDFPLGEIEVPNNPEHFIRLVFSGTTAGTSWFSQRLENVASFSGKKITLSFFIKADQPINNLSSRAWLNFGSGGSTSIGVPGNYNVTNQWTKVTITYDIPNISSKTVGPNAHLEIRPINADGSTSITGRTIDIAQVQLSVGDVDLPYQPRSYGEELTLCQRYCCVITDDANTNVSYGTGFASTTTRARILVKFPVTLRTTPTLVATASDFQVYDGVTATSLSAIAVGNNEKSKDTVMLLCDVASGLTQFRPYLLWANGAAGKKLLFDAEL